MGAKSMLYMIGSVYAAANGEACTKTEDCTAAATKTACCGYKSVKDTATVRMCWEDTTAVTEVAGATGGYGFKTGDPTVTGWNKTTMKFRCDKPYGDSGINLKAGVVSLFTGIALLA